MHILNETETLHGGRVFEKEELVPHKTIQSLLQLHSSQAELKVLEGLICSKNAGRSGPLYGGKQRNTHFYMPMYQLNCLSLDHAKGSCAAVLVPRGRGLQVLAIAGNHCLMGLCSSSHARLM